MHEQEMLVWSYTWVWRHDTLTYAYTMENVTKKGDKLELVIFHGSNGWA